MSSEKLNNNPENTNTPQAAEEKLNNPENNFGDMATKEIATLKPESRHFFGKLYEKIKSTEIVQNAIDRHEISRNNKLSKRAGGKIDSLDVEKSRLDERTDKTGKTIDQKNDQLDKVSEIYRSLGKEVNQDTIKKIQEETKILRGQQEQLKAEAQAKQGEITDVANALKNYQENAESARGQIIGRIDAKIDINTEQIRAKQGKITTIDNNYEKNTVEIDKLKKPVAELEKLIASGLSGELLNDVKKELANINTQIKTLSSTNKELFNIKKKTEKEIGDLNSEKTKWQTKRDKITPQEENSGGKPAEKPVSYNLESENSIRMSYGGGKIIDLSSTDGTMIITNPAGDQETFELAKIPPEYKKHITAIPSEQLTNVGFPPAFISQIDQAREQPTETDTFTASDIILKWNRTIKKIKSLKGLSIAFDSHNINLDEQFINEDGAKDFLIKQISKKVKAQKLSLTILEKINNFFVNYKNQNT